jgi:hypothetical protein
MSDKKVKRGVGSPLSAEQWDHLLKLNSEIADRMVEKYTTGAVEHGGNLWDKGEDYLLDAAIDEAVDQLVYLLTLKHKARVRQATAEKQLELAMEAGLPPERYEVEVGTDSKPGARLLRTMIEHGTTSWPIEGKARTCRVVEATRLVRTDPPGDRSDRTIFVLEPVA